MASGLSCILDSPPTPATITEDNTTERGDLIGGNKRRGRPLSPLSPAESLENLPPTTPTEEYHFEVLPTNRGRLLEYRGHTYPSPPTTTSDPRHPVPLPSAITFMTTPTTSLSNLPSTPAAEYQHHSETIPTIRGRLLEYRYPSPPSTASDPKHPVPLPSSITTTAIPATSNTTTNTYDIPYDIPYDFLPPASSGVLLDSPVVAQRGPIHHRTQDQLRLTSAGDSLSQQGLPVLQSIPEEDLAYLSSDFEGSYAINGRACRMQVLPQENPPISPTSPLLELRAAIPTTKSAQGAPNAPLPTLSTDWEADELDAYPSTSTVVVPVGGRHTSSNPREWTYSTSPTSRPILPLLSIPDSDYLTSRSYAPSPTSPLWLADEFLFSALGLPSPPGSDDTPDTSSGSEAEHGGDRYMISPPSSGPPDTPSPLLPLLELDDDHGGWSERWQDCDGDSISQENDIIPPIPELFEYPSSPSVSIRSLESEAQGEGIPLLEAGVDQDEKSIECCALADFSPWRAFEVEESGGSWGEDPNRGWHEGGLFDPELLRSPSVQFRQCMQLPDDDDFHSYPSESLARTPSPFDSDTPTATSRPYLDAAPSHRGPDSMLLRPLAAFGSGDDPDLLFPDASPTPRPLPLDLDSDFDLNALDPDTMKRLPPQEVEEVQRLAELQAKANESERAAKELEARVAQSVALDEEKNGTADGTRGKAERFTEEDDRQMVTKAAAEARALAKREREKAKEAGALVRLKLMEIEEDIGKEEEEWRSGLLEDKRSRVRSTSPLAPSSSDRPERHPPSTSTPSTFNIPTPTISAHSRHPRLAGVAQLVAKMFLNRPDSGVRRMPMILSSSNAIPSSGSSMVALDDEPSSSTSSSSVPPSSSSSSFHVPPNPSLHPTISPPISPSPTSLLPSAPAPKISPYKYKHLWMKGVTAAGLHPQQSAISPSGGFGTLGATRQQPFARYQRRYKFLRSSPLAKYSVVASDDDSSGEGLEDVSARVQGGQEQVGKDGDVGALWDDLEDDLDGGFEALRNPIMWDDI